LRVPPKKPAVQAETGKAIASTDEAEEAEARAVLEAIFEEGAADAAAEEEAAGGFDADAEA